MIEYPTIPYKDECKFLRRMRGGAKVFVFDKLDGSNVRAEWTRKNGLFKFGTRRRLLGPEEQPIGQAIPLIHHKYEEAIAAAAKALHVPRLTAFFEFYGPNSFAGTHQNEQHKVTILDVATDEGIIPAKLFLKLFSGVEVPDLLYEGVWDPAIEKQVIEGTYPGMTFEGVIAKGVPPMMFKLKSQAWFDKLKAYCKGDAKLYANLV